MMTLTGESRSRWTWLAVVGLVAGCGGSEVAVQHEALADGGNCEVIAGPDIRRQGVLDATGIDTDLALGGPGFFMVDASGEHGGPVLYTRDGRFTTDREGYLVNLRGMRVIGFPADERGSLSGTPAFLLVGRAVMAPMPTRTVKVIGNVDAEAPISMAAFDPVEPHLMSTGSALVWLYDSLGVMHLAEIFFLKTATNVWDFHMLTDGGGLTGGTSGVRAEIASGTLTFDQEGSLLSAVQTLSAFNPIGAGNPQELQLDFGDAVSLGGGGKLGLRQLGMATGFPFVVQDGLPPGTLSTLSVNATGAILGLFTNGGTWLLGRVAVALFPAPVWLSAHGGHLYAPTGRSGEAELGAGCEGLRGCIQSGFVEQLLSTSVQCLSGAP